jgi:DNA-damage-inducible protein J
MFHLLFQFVLQSARLCNTKIVKGGVTVKDATVSARVECDVKNEAEDILQKLGIPVSVVINSLYRQIIYRHGVPFSLTIPQEPKTLDAMSEAELNAKLMHSYEQSLRGEGRPFSEVFDELESGLR